MSKELSNLSLLNKCFEKLKAIKVILAAALFYCLLFTNHVSAFNSFGEHQTFVSNSTWPASICQGQFVNPFTFGFTSLPDELGSDSNPSNDYTADWLTQQIATYATVAILTGGIGFAVTAVVTIAEMAAFCTWTWVFAPNEYVMFKAAQDHLPIMPNGSQASDISCHDVNNQKVVYMRGGGMDYRVSPSEVPYYYHCDPNYSPSVGNLSPYDSNQAKHIGRTRGYEGLSGLCDGRNQNYAMKSYVPKIVVGYQEAFKAQMSKLLGSIPPLNYLASYDYCSIGDTDVYALNPGDNPVCVQGDCMKKLVSYYKFDEVSGKIRICAANIGLPAPVEVGCTGTAPPAEIVDVPNFYLQYFNNTRCMYLVEGRTDLREVAKIMQSYDVSGEIVVNDEAYDAEGNYAVPVRRFLNSDFHFVSTVVGCIQDMLLKVIYMPASYNVSLSGSSSGISVASGYNVENGATKSFFAIIQSRVKPLVYSVLMLSICLLGVRIISNSQPTPRGEILMYFIKFAVVVYFAIGPGWYSTNPSFPGLFPALLDAPAEIADLFLQTQAENDPASYCYYNYGGDKHNLLGENIIPVSQNETYGFSAGSSKVAKMTVWDLIDCKVANYLNFGSCDFSMLGMLSLWMLMVTIFAPTPIALLIGICSFIYAFMMLFVVFRYTHIFLLSIMTITVLVFVSPIFLVMALFDKTKEIFMNWTKSIFGYILYPSLLFAFLALMLSTMDIVFYGSIYNQDIPLTNGVKNFSQACSNKTDSVFCMLVKQTSPKEGNFCKSEVGYLSSQLLNTISVFWVWTTIGELDDFPNLLWQTLKLLLFAFLFYIFLGFVSEYLAMLTGAMSLDSYAKGSVNFINYAATVKGLYDKAIGAGKDAATGAAGAKAPRGGGGRAGGSGGGAGGGGGAAGGAGGGGAAGGAAASGGS